MEYALTCEYAQQPRHDPVHRLTCRCLWSRSLCPLLGDAHLASHQTPKRTLGPSICFSFFLLLSLLNPSWQLFPSFSAPTPPSPHHHSH